MSSIECFGCPAVFFHWNRLFPSHDRGAVQNPQPHLSSVALRSRRSIVRQSQIVVDGHVPCFPFHADAKLVQNSFDGRRQLLLNWARVQNLALQLSLGRWRRGAIHRESRHEGFAAVEAHGGVAAKRVLVDERVHRRLPFPRDHPHPVPPIARGRVLQLVQLLQWDEPGLPTLRYTWKIHGLEHEGRLHECPVKVPPGSAHVPATLTFVVGNPKDIRVGRSRMLVESAFDSAELRTEIHLPLPAQILLPEEQKPMLFDVFLYSGYESWSVLD
mmetsp:Transcript_15503/g.31855  ORF Transcript_15503/g.31855 Transcript_15503/m.31855 type:complete len:272 (-) Transcript_15503:174-989(-)